jgi:hypothetical protein
MNYKITYQIQQSFGDTINESFIETRLLPLSDDSQVMVHYELSNSLHEAFFTAKNAFGCISQRLRTSKPYQELGITLSAEVHKKRSNHHPLKTLPIKEEHKILESSDFLIEHHLFLYRSKYTNWNQLPKKFPVLKANTSINQYHVLLSDFIHETVKFSKQANPLTSIDQIMKEQAANSIDYAHFFIAACKSQKIPARMAVGFINPSKKLIGAGQLYAWAEYYVPNIGWLGYDVCNQRNIDEHYIKLCHGADYADCKVFTNILKVNTTSKTNVQLKIQTLS